MGRLADGLDVEPAPFPYAHAVDDWTVETWMLVIGVVTLIVTIGGTVAAILAAKYARPAWKGSRAKPDLQLSVRKGPGDWFDLRLTNSGEGTARNWIVTLTVPSRGGSLVSADEYYRRGKYVRGWSDRRTTEGWIGTWMSDRGQ